jgi:ABC-type glycerol-3-phosphate transport system permease component
MAVKRRPVRNKILMHLALLPFLLFALFPFYHMTLTSLKTDRELYDRTAAPLLIRQGPTPSTTRSSSRRPHSSRGRRTA